MGTRHASPQSRASTNATRSKADLARLKTAAAEVFGWSQLSREQLAAMAPLLTGRDVLAVLPTGAGKSAIYQVPTVLLPGLTVVVSPLLALQRDQIDRITESRAPAAVAVNSDQRVSDRRQAWQAVSENTAQYLFLSPEQLGNAEILERLAGVDVGLFVVDEAHCVSAWGHDFRPEYLRLLPVIEQLGHPPVLGLTATAALPVRQDIEARLGLVDPVEVIASFDRPNLHLAVHHATDDHKKRNAVIAEVRALVGEVVSGCGLLYTASRKDAEFYAASLREHGLRAAPYHAGLSAAQRAEVHDAFLDDELDVVAATSAFGMGIDHPTVRFIVHASAQDSLDSYYQQIGRAGRDGEPASVSLFYRPQDLHLQTFLTATRTPEKVLSAVVTAVREETEALSPAALTRMVGASRPTVMRAVNLLEQAAAIGTTDTGRLRYRDPGLRPAEAVNRAVALSEQHQQLIRSRIEMMRGYAETTGCRRQFLLGYFGEQLPRPCGNCDTCEAGTARDEPRHHITDFSLNSTVRHSDWGEGIVMSVEPDRITVLFGNVGYKTLSLRTVRSQRLLEPVVP
jgi:ATP-dependent DNA helicase RecQ